MVEKFETTVPLPSDSVDMIKGQVIRQMTGGSPGQQAPRPLTPVELNIAQRVYDDIRQRGTGNLFSAALSATLFNAMAAWYAEMYEYSIAIATHVIEDIEPMAGEAYRIRAFSRIALQQYPDARDDLREALSRTPSLSGAKEPLAAMDRLVGSNHTATTAVANGSNGGMFGVRFLRVFLFVWASTTLYEYRNYSHHSVVDFILNAVLCTFNGIVCGAIIAGIWDRHRTPFKAARKSEGAGS